MNRTPVTSTNIRSVGYDATTQMLEIEFQNGKIYTYAGVPEDKVTAMMKNNSVGSYFNANIKPNYTTKQVG